MHKLRMRYSKTGTAKYISHLDLMSAMARALRRAGIGLQYSEGYNPHPYLSVALPLPVGSGSLCELMDFGTQYELLPDGLTDLINTELPEGLEALDVYKPDSSFNEIKWLKLSGTLHYDKGAPDNATASLNERFKMEHIVIIKKTKRGVSEIDLIPYINNVAFFGNDVIKFDAVVSAQNPSITPRDLISALEGEFDLLKPDFSSFTRVELFAANMTVFR